MLVLPAIDLRGGKCVRLSQGRADRETVYGEDPAGVARAFQQQGARMLHLVDLDGAFRGASGNRAAIEAIRAAVSIPLEVGGGMRAFAAISDMLAMGVDSVIIGTWRWRIRTIWSGRWGSSARSPSNWGLTPARGGSP